MKILIYLQIALINLTTSAFSYYNWETIYEWNQIEFDFSSEKERSNAISNKSFNVGKLLAIDAQYTFNYEKGERIFITVPRLGKGRPATFGTVIKNKTFNNNPIISPYPSWSWQINLEKCHFHRIVSVFRVWVDECDRLWIVDTGKDDSTFICAPQILAFNLKTDELLYKYEIPYSQYNNFSLFITIIAEIEDKKDSCINSWIYVADCYVSSLLVYDLKSNKSWSIQDKSFNINPNFVNYTVDGVNFTLKDGLTALALLNKPRHHLDKELFYHALANIEESKVNTRFLKDRNNFLTPNSSTEFFKTFKTARGQQSSVEAFDRNGNLYFSLINKTEIVKWNSYTQYSPENFQIIGHDSKTMQFPSSLKITNDKGRYETLWAFTTKEQKYVTGILNGNTTNFILLKTRL